MLPEKKGALTAIVLISAVFLGFALFADLPALHDGFLTADQAAYYSIASSLAYDHDLEYTKKDLVRYQEQFWAGPQGVFLKRIKTPAGDKLFFAKSMAYALFAAPFVRVFGPNGPLVFHAILIFLLLLMGSSYFALRNSPGLSTLKVGAFLFASVAGAYTVWIAPDFFNLFCVFTVLFLWLYKHRKTEEPTASAQPPAEAEPQKARRSRWTAFILSDGSDYLAAAVSGIAAYAKPPNVAVFGPLLLWTLLKKRPGKAVLLVLVFALAFGVLFGANFLLTGDWNYQGGERKSFYYSFPYERPDLTFDSARGRLMSTDGYLERALLPAKFVPINLFYFVFGRFSGMAWYFFPAILALILFFLGKKSLDRWLLLAAIAGEILIYVVLMPDNFGGGGGSLANRYFLGIYPLFFFLPRLQIKPRHIATEWAAAALLIAPILISPIQAAHAPADRAKHFPFTLFPIELTLINDLPTNTNPAAFRQQWGEPLFDDRFLYFLNDNYNPKHREENGWWTLGDRKVEFILRTAAPAKEVVFHLLNSPRLENEVTIWMAGQKKTIKLGSQQRGDLRFAVGDGFIVRHARMYRVRIKASKSSTPYFEDGQGNEKRWLGVFFTPELISP
ncbi:MAG: hypothetical protein ACYDH3_10220 [Candidatus Aminicenantales bacterium]